MDNEEKKLEFGRAVQYTITIESSDNNGFIVNVGCGKFAFSNKDDMLEAIQEYVNNPKVVEKRYNSSNISRELRGIVPRGEMIQERGLPRSNREEESCDDCGPALCHGSSSSSS